MVLVVVLVELFWEAEGMTLRDWAAWETPSEMGSFPPPPTGGVYRPSFQGAHIPAQVLPAQACLSWRQAKNTHTLP